MSDSLTSPASSNVASLKIPPHSIEAEQAVIGGLLLDNRAWEKIADKVTSADFYRDVSELIIANIIGCLFNRLCLAFLKEGKSHLPLGKQLWRDMVNVGICFS